MHVLNLIVVPNLLVTRAYGLERIVDVAERDPAAAEGVGEEALVGKVVVLGGIGGVEGLDDLVVEPSRGLDHLETPVADAQADGAGCTGLEGFFGSRVLGGVGTV